MSSPVQRYPDLASGQPDRKCWCRTHLRVVNLSFDWAIDNFSMVSKKTGEVLESDSFSAEGYEDIEWRIKMYPKGETKETAEYVSMFLQLITSNLPEIPTLCAFSILDVHGERKYVSQFETVHKFKPTDDWGYGKFVKLSSLTSSHEDLLPGDQLHVRCNLRMVVDSISMSGKNNKVVCEVSECHLSEDLGKMLASRKFTDVVLVACDGKEFPAHKALLAARSAVFASMFEHRMKESVENRVDIADIDGEALKELLHFIYTGNAPNLSRKVEGLLSVADKYELDRLKELCEEHLARNISIDSAAEAYVLADLHNAIKLKACALDFICDHAVEFLEESGWENLIVHHPDLANEISKTIVARSAEPPLKRMKPY